MNITYQTAFDCNLTKKLAYEEDLNDGSWIDGLDNLSIDNLLGHLSNAGIEPTRGAVIRAANVACRLHQKREEEAGEVLAW